MAYKEVSTDHMIGGTILATAERLFPDGIATLNEYAQQTGVAASTFRRGATWLVELLPGPLLCMVPRMAGERSVSPSFVPESLRLGRLKPSTRVSSATVCTWPPRTAGWKSWNSAPNPAASFPGPTSSTVATPAPATGSPQSWRRTAQVCNTCSKPARLRATHRLGHNVPGRGLLNNPSSLTGSS